MPDVFLANACVWYYYFDNFPIEFCEKAKECEAKKLPEISDEKTPPAFLLYKKQRLIFSNHHRKTNWYKKKKKKVGIWASLIFFDQGQELKGKGFIFFIFSVPSRDYFNIFKASYKVCPVHEKI